MREPGFSGIIRAVCVASGLIALGACETLDQYAVGETHRLDRAPWYRSTAEFERPAGGSVVLLPVTLQSRVNSSFMYGDRTDEFEPLLRALNERAASARPCCRSTTSAPAGEGPQVYVGIAGGDLAPMETEDQRLETDRFAPMVLSIARPETAWRDGLAKLAGTGDARWFLHLQLGVSQYAKGREGLIRKQVTLGTGHVQPIRFLTAEDKPVEVLHLTGVLVDANGRIVRAGAEGIIARDTPFSAQVFEMSKALDDLDLGAALEERRTDLPGSPRKWEMAFDNLISQLTLGSVVVPAAP
jgi:hypothetical protein